MTDQEKLVHNERLKLACTFLNNGSIVLFAVGGYVAFIANPNRDFVTFLVLLLFALGLLLYTCSYLIAGLLRS